MRLLWNSMRIKFFSKKILSFSVLYINGVNARNTKLKGKEWIILSTIPLNSLFFSFQQICGWHEESNCTLKCTHLKPKASQLLQISYCYQSHLKTTYQAGHSYQMLKFSKLHSRSAKGTSSSPAPLSPLPSSCQHFKWQQVQETSVLSDSICVCASVSEPTAT